MNQFQPCTFFIQTHKTSVVWHKYGSLSFYGIKIRKQMYQVQLSIHHQLLYFLSRIFHFSSGGWDLVEKIAQIMRKMGRRN